LIFNIFSKIIWKNNWIFLSPAMFRCYPHELQVFSWSNEYLPVEDWAKSFLDHSTSRIRIGILKGFRSRCYVNDGKPKIMYSIRQRLQSTLVWKRWSHFTALCRDKRTDFPCYENWINWVIREIIRETFEH